MVALQSILSLLPKDVWLASIDLQDVYFHGSIHPQHHCFLWLCVGPHHYRVHTLPFGLSTAPRVFTNCMVVVAVFVHQKGIVLFLYISNWLLVSSSVDQLLADVGSTLLLLKCLGLCVNLAKCHLHPTQELQFIGTVLNVPKHWSTYLWTEQSCWSVWCSRLFGLPHRWLSWCSTCCDSWQLRLVQYLLQDCTCAPWSYVFSST